MTSLSGAAKQNAIAQLVQNSGIYETVTAVHSTVLLYSKPVRVRLYKHVNKESLQYDKLKLLIDNWEFNFDRRYVAYIKTKYIDFRKDKYFLDEGFQIYIEGAEIARIVTEINSVLIMRGISL